jgi:sRNA-binding carbon storage regulator CsrA
MRVLTRACREAVIIATPAGETVVFTVVSVEPKRVALSVERLNSTETSDPSSVINIGLGETTTNIRDSVNLSYVAYAASREHPTARLGITAPKEYAVHRKEVWDVIHGMEPGNAARQVPYELWKQSVGRRNMYERFTDRARKVMQLANQEAQRFHHEYIGTEHILLGVVKEGSGVAANVLKNLDIDLRKIRLEVEKIVQSGPDMVTMGKLPQTPRAKKVIEYSIEEARTLNHNYVGTEHLLLGLIRENDSVAAQVLMNLGLQLEDLREEVMKILGHDHWTSIKSKEAAYSELSSVIRDEVQAMDALIEQLQGRKEASIAQSDFEEAARCRDEQEKLKDRRAKLLRKAVPTPAASVRQYELYLPSILSDGSQLADSSLLFVRNQLTTRFGGYSEHTEQIGGEWKIGNVVFRGTVVVFRVFAEELLHPRDFFKQLTQQLRGEMKIDQVVVVERKVDVL